MDADNVQGLSLLILRPAPPNPIIELIMAGPLWIGPGFAC